MNKKLVIAALLAAAAAQGEENVVEENADNAPAEENADNAPAENENAENAENAENNEPAGEEPAGEEPAGEENAEEKADDDDKEEGGDGDKEDGDKGDKDARAAWKEILGQDGEGKDIERVLCAGWGDEGERALWDEAQEKFKDLQGRAGKAKEAVDAAQKNFDDLQQSLADRKQAADAHRAAGKTYLDAWTDADNLVKALVEAAKGADETADKAGKLTGFTDKTALAEGAVDSQRERVEKILLAKRTQDGEEALWAERVTAANTAMGVASDVKDAADDAVDEVKEQVSTRSWIFAMMGEIDVTLYAANCNTAETPCALVETPSVA
jgi:hypothetical protein